MNLDLLKKFISLKTITPDKSKKILEIIPYIEKLGFKTQIINKNGHYNLFFIKNEGFKNICFAGHFDVVDTVDNKLWLSNPFILYQKESFLYGRGIVDMKGALFCFLEAVSRNEYKNKTISILLTSDEEHTSENGMPVVIDWLQKNKIKIDFCIVGEPTSDKNLGDVIKNGRRGSINYQVIITGKQGHVAYPEKCINPIQTTTTLLQKINSNKIDNGNKSFEPSNCEIVSIKSSSNINNIIPNSIEIKFNIRFNNIKTKEKITREYDQIINSVKEKNIKIKKEIQCNSEPFLSEVKKNYLDLVKQSVYKVTKKRSQVKNNGGTSDARYIHKICPTIEIGLKNNTAHKINEKTSIDDIKKLSDIYTEILKNFK